MGINWHSHDLPSAWIVPGGTLFWGNSNHVAERQFMRQSLNSWCIASNHTGRLSTARFFLQLCYPRYIMNKKGAKQMGNVLYEAQFQFTSSMWLLLIVPVMFFIWPWIQNKLSTLIGRELPKIVAFPRTACITFGCIAAVVWSLYFFFKAICISRL